MTVTALVLTLPVSGCILGGKKFDFSEKSNFWVGQASSNTIETIWADVEGRPLT
jgi:hypothetical protein